MMAVQSRPEGSGPQPGARIKRLLQLVWLLQSANRTCEKLSELFAVSKRTIFRDIQLLRDSGVPIECDDPAGGYRVAKNVLFATQLEPAELVALDLANDGPELAGLNGFPQLRQVALAKLMCGSRSEVRLQVERVVASVRQLAIDGTLDTHDTAAICLLLDSWLGMAAGTSERNSHAAKSATVNSEPISLS